MGRLEVSQHPERLKPPDLGRDYLEEAVMLKEIIEGIDLDISPRSYSLEEYLGTNRGQFLYDEIICKGKPIEI